MNTRVPGSIERKITATELVEERAKCNFDMAEMEDIIFKKSPEVKAQFKGLWDDLQNDPVLKTTHQYYEWTREEIQYNWMKKLNYMYHKDKKRYFGQMPNVRFNWIVLHHG